MKRTPLRRLTSLKRTAMLKPTSWKTQKRNGIWKQRCIERASYLIEKYGQLVCEYSGETIINLASVPNTPDDGWGHHIDHDRNNISPDNCYITKYKYHNLIHDKNITVKQEGFEGRR